MNVLFVSEYFPPKIMGGGEVNLQLLARALSKKGVNVSVLTSHHKEFKKYEEYENIRIYRRLKTAENPQGITNNLIRSLLFPLSVTSEVKKLCQENKIDVIHFIGSAIISVKKVKKIKRANTKLFATIESYPTLCPKGDRIYKNEKECNKTCTLPLFLKCQNKSSEIGKTKNSWYLKYNPFFHIYLYSYYKRLNNSLKHCKLISISNYVSDLLNKQGLASTVIPNAINIGDFNKNSKTKEQNENIKILYLGSLTKFKGPQVLVKALEGLNYNCDFYGKGILKSHLEKIISQSKINAKIHSPVSYNEIPQLYANADLVVFPSIWPEPFGRISIEAMAAGKVVIGSRIGGIKETINETHGVLVTPGDVNELREKIIELAENKELRETLEREGERIVKQNYDETIVINKLIETYKT